MSRPWPQTSLCNRAITRSLVLAVVACVAAQPHLHTHIKSDLQNGSARRLQADDACYTTSSAAFLVNTTVQVQASQQLNDSSATASFQQALSQYLHSLDCNMHVAVNGSTNCSTTSSADTTAACNDSTYICRGVVEVPVDVYNAIQNSTCSPNDATSTVTCLSSTLDLTTYLDVQQGQCCLQCPDQPDCLTSTAASANAPVSAIEVPLQCSNLSVSLAVGDSLAGSSAKAELADAVDSGLLDQYLHAAGLLDATALSVGPTGQLGVLCCAVLCCAVPCCAWVCCIGPPTCAMELRT